MIEKLIQQANKNSSIVQGERPRLQVFVTEKADFSSIDWNAGLRRGW
jgi:hypothetical protein